MTDLPQSEAPIGGGVAVGVAGTWQSPAPLYAATLFVSAALLFWVQPLVAKMMLPLLGGAPAVWNTAMMFFQITLFAGYAYAHALSRLPPIRQAWVHGAVLLAALAVLPIGIAGRSPPADASTALLVVWLFAQLGICVGLPFFALSASAPLLQGWLARTGHAHAHDPYFLYGASNLGSLVALLAFPLVFEPWLTLTLQSRIWMVIYAALIVMIGAAAAQVRRGIDPAGAAPAAMAAPSAASRPGERWLWIALAFVPSSLLLGVTSFITTDVASVPLLWVIPLALYLLSFVVVFARRPVLRTSWTLAAHAGAIAMLLFFFILPAPSFGVLIVVHYLAFFLTAVICHGALASRRPPAARLTEFYLCLSVGGALGGIFNALVAPVIFSATYEYPLALVFACLLRRAAEPRPAKPNAMDAGLPALLLVATAAVLWKWHAFEAISLPAFTILLFALAAVVIFFSQRGLRFGLAVAAILVPVTLARTHERTLEQERSFFGVNRVTMDEKRGLIDLMHGTTLHGAEHIDPTRWRDQVGYYHQAGPIGQLFAEWRRAHAAPLRAAVIGLGTGTLACYSRPSEPWTFYEIDPSVVRLARDTRHFHYLEQCGQTTEIVLGDARLSLANGPDRRYDVLILDAFSSDAIPTHLLTHEAMRLYLDHLAESGVVVMHISNNYLGLAPMLAASARTLGLSARHELFVPTAEERADGAVLSEWVAMARRPADLAFLDGEPRWKPLAPARAVTPWTDDFSNIVSVLK